MLRMVAKEISLLQDSESAAAGVTEITGEGESIALLNDRILKEQEDFSGRFNLTVDWHTLSESFNRLDEHRFQADRLVSVGVPPLGGRVRVHRVTPR
jgi:hypothetical protein